MSCIEFSETKRSVTFIVKTREKCILFRTHLRKDIVLQHVSFSNIFPPIVYFFPNNIIVKFLDVIVFHFYIILNITPIILRIYFR